MRLTKARALALLVGCGTSAATACAVATGPAVAGGVHPCFSEVPPVAGNPQWGFHTGLPITGKNGSYARAVGDVDLSSGSVSGTVCQVDVAGGIQRLIVLKPVAPVTYHTHFAKLWGHLGNLMQVHVKVRSSTDKKCKVGTVGKMTVDATYDGVKSASVQFAFPASCKSHSHTYHGSQVDALVPES